MFVQEHSAVASRVHQDAADGSHGALGLAPQVEGRRGKPGRDSGVSGATLSRAAPTIAYVPHQGEWRGAARAAQLSRCGMMTPVRTNGDAPASAGASGCAIRRRTRRESAEDRPKKPGEDPGSDPNDDAWLRIAFGRNAPERRRARW